MPPPLPRLMEKAWECGEELVTSLGKMGKKVPKATPPNLLWETFLCHAQCAMSMSMFGHAISQPRDVATGGENMAKAQTNVSK